MNKKTAEWLITAGIMALIAGLLFFIFGVREERGDVWILGIQSGRDSVCIFGGVVAIIGAGAVVRGIFWFRDPS